MSWIELIRVRTCEPARRTTLPAVEEQIQEIATANSSADVFFLEHSVYGTDLAVVIVWKTDVVPGKTREGALIAESLQGFGLVEHAVWQPRIR